MNIEIIGQDEKVVEAVRNKISTFKPFYEFYADAGHGWLKVDIMSIIQAGIQKEISSYSYIKGNDVYLEEDCDMALFMRAGLKQGIHLKVKEMPSVDNSNIRTYRNYIR